MKGREQWASSKKNSAKGYIFLLPAKIRGPLKYFTGISSIFREFAARDKKPGGGSGRRAAKIQKLCAAFPMQ